MVTHIGRPLITGGRNSIKLELVSVSCILTFACRLGNGSMPAYRLFLLNPHSGHIESVEEFHSADNVEAICLVSQRHDGVPVELWCGRTKVARFDGQREQAAAILPVASC